jgi:hypothetical protein
MKTRNRLCIRFVFEGSEFEFVPCAFYSELFVHEYAQITNCVQYTPLRDANNCSVISAIPCLVWNTVVYWNVQNKAVPPFDAVTSHVNPVKFKTACVVALV